ncbi:hypothetical protein DJ66_0697 [Candidatus Liberibacter solanacearum]|uniref:Uncharacterized protein n=1 Tax=Candidatus Liberibacter solanacearum TaxID=556287 RepID=A0A0F4VMP9_9HYPH|nr:hypothetical protein DJ66_0697 [Candidatus Liberibacter solanacearum]
MLLIARLGPGFKPGFFFLILFKLLHLYKKFDFLFYAQYPLYKKLDFFLCSISIDL